MHVGGWLLFRGSQTHREKTACGVQDNFSLNLIKKSSYLIKIYLAINCIQLDLCPSVALLMLLGDFEFFNHSTKTVLFFVFYKF